MFNMTSPQSVAAKQRECAKILRSHLPSGGPASSDYLVANPELICNNFEGIVLELSQLPYRKGTSFLTASVLEGFPRMPKPEGKLFAERLLAATEHVRQTKKSMTSGKKSHPAVVRIIRKLEGARPSLPTLPSSSSLEASPPSRSHTAPSLSQSKAMTIPDDVVRNLYSNFLDSTQANLAEDAEEEAMEEDGVEEIFSSEEEIGCASAPSQKLHWMSSKDIALVRPTANGSLAVATMIPGIGGTAVGQFPDSDTEHQSDIPNDVLVQFQASTDKQKPCLKRPASAMKKPASQRQARKPPVEGELTTRSVSNDLYAVMHYTKTNKFAVRARGANQLWQIDGLSRSVQDNLKLMKIVVEKLTAGETPMDVKSWALEQP